MEIYEDLLNLLEEVINELDDETVQAVLNKRKENAEKAIDKYNKLKFTVGAKKEEVEAADKEQEAAWNKLVRSSRLSAQRDKRIQKKVEEFKNKLLNRKPQKASVTDKAGSDHDNAIIDQHYRSKLEKTFSNECLEEIISLIEGKVIDFQEKRRDKVLNKNAEEFARMARGGELEAVRILPNGEFMGDPHYVKKLNDIKKENEQVMGRWKKNG